MKDINYSSIGKVYSLEYTEIPKVDDVSRAAKKIRNWKMNSDIESQWNICVLQGHRSNALKRDRQIDMGGPGRRSFIVNNRRQPEVSVLDGS